MTWMPIWAMPNIELDEPVDSNFFALVPFNDPRVRRIKRQHPEFRKFMASFTDTFKNRIHPTLIIRRADAPERLQTSEAAAGFRDLLVASVSRGFPARAAGVPAGDHRDWAQRLRGRGHTRRSGDRGCVGVLVGGETDRSPSCRLTASRAQRCSCRYRPPID